MDSYWHNILFQYIYYKLVDLNHQKSEQLQELDRQFHMEHFHNADMSLVDGVLLDYLFHLNSNDQFSSSAFHDDASLLSFLRLEYYFQY